MLTGFEWSHAKSASRISKAASMVAKASSVILTDFATLCVAFA